MFGLEIFGNLLSSWPFFQVWAYLVFGLFSKSLYSKIQNLAFLKTEFDLFQLQAPGNPASCHKDLQSVGPPPPSIPPPPLRFGRIVSRQTARGARG